MHLLGPQSQCLPPLVGGQRHGHPSTVPPGLGSSKLLCNNAGGATETRWRTKVNMIRGVHWRLLFIFLVIGTSCNLSSQVDNHVP